MLMPDTKNAPPKVGFLKIKDHERVKLERQTTYRQTPEKKI